MARVEERRDAYRILVRKHEGRRPLGRTRRKWEDNIKMDLVKKYGLCGLDSSGSEQEQVVGCCRQGNESFGAVSSGKVHGQLRKFKCVKDFLSVFISETFSLDE